MAWVKQYLKAIEKKLTAMGKEDRIPGFKQGATELVKLIIARFDEFQFFVGSKYDMEGALVFAYQKNDEDSGPTFLYFRDGLKEEKFWAPDAIFQILLEYH